MKSRIHILSLALFAFSAVRMNAQIDVTINPLGLLFGNINVGADFALSDDFSIEGNIGYASSKSDISGEDVKYTGIPVQAVGKYYFNPNKGADKFYGAAFLRYVNRSYKYDDNSLSANFNLSRFGAGIGVGYKTVSKSNIVLDFGLNIGRVIADNTKYEDNQGNQQDISLPGLIVDLKLGLGYRF